VSLVASSPAVDNEWVGGFVTVPRTSCLLAYARAASSVGDVDVAVYSDEGTSLAVDEGRDVHPTVLLCPPHPDRVYVAAHLVEGEGLVAVGAQLVPRERGVIVARSLGARGAAQAPRPADAWPGLADAVRAHRAGLGATWDEFKRVALPVDPRLRTYVAMRVDADECVDAVVVPDEDVDLLDVEVIDAAGRVVARARDGAGARSVTVCSPFTVPGTLSLRPRVGRGLAAVVLARASGDVARDLSTRPDVAWATAVVSVDEAKSARNALLTRSGYAAALSTTTGALAMGRRASIPMDLQGLLPGACARVDIVAGAPLALFDAQLRADDGSLVAADEAPASVTLFACERGTPRLELEARGRPGPYAVLVRREPWHSDSFAAHPLAASRMLGRAALGPSMLLGGHEGATRQLVLDETHLASWNETLPAGRCVRVTVGAEGQGAGLDLRVLDETGNEIDRAHAAHATSVRACASQEGSRSVRFEVGADAGHLDAVVGERIENLVER
jgi:hypothetical protein